MKGPFTIIYQDKIFDPYFNLATEEYLLQGQKKLFDKNILFIYRNKPSVVCGKNQSIWAEANLQYCRKNGILLNKRVSGGGTVFHDLGNINFSFFTPRRSEWVSNFSIFNNPVIEFLNANKVKAYSNDRNDILIENLKISGNAQHISGEQMISHATLLFDANLNNVSSSLNHEFLEVRSTSIKSKKVPVTNIKKYGFDVSTEEFIEHFIGFMKNNLAASVQIGFDNEICKNIKEIADSKYSKDSWIYGNSPKTLIKIELPFQNQICILSISLERGKVVDLNVEPNIEKLNNLLNKLLLNKLFSYKDVIQKISKSQKGQEEFLDSFKL